MRVAILHQGFVPEYRVRFFELLNQRNGSEYVVFHGHPPSGIGQEAATGPFAFPNVFVDNRELVLAGSRSVTYQPVVRSIQGGGFDAVVLGSHLQFVSNHVVFVLSRLVGRAVLYWGHGFERVPHFAASTHSGWGRSALLERLSRLGVQLKYAVSRLPDGYLVYSAGGAERLLANGVNADRITVVRNTLDMEAQVRLSEQARSLDEAELRRQLGLEPDSVVLVCLGRIYASKRVENLVEAARLLSSQHRTRRSFQIVIIGDGPTAEEARARATGLENVIFTGAIRDQSLVARYLRVAAGVAIPGVVGLVANHALAHGLPIINQTTDLHGPEAEYLTEGSDTLVAQDFEGFVDLLAEFIDSPELQLQLTEGALAARDALSLEPMVDAFDRGVTQAVARTLARRRRRRSTLSPPG